MTKKMSQCWIEIVIITILTAAAAAILILLCGANPLDAVPLFLRGIFGTQAGFAEIFVKACPLVFTGIGCAVAFQTGFFNIGAEGQFYLGAIAGTITVLYLPVPGTLRIIFAFVFGFLAGGVWALIAAVLKSKWNISEIIVTIMLNYIAINFVGYAVRSFLQDPDGNVPQSARIESAAQLKPIIEGTRFHEGIVLAVVCTILIWFLLNRTTYGFELKAVGLNQRAALVNGLPTVRTIVSSAFLSGGLSAMAGVTEVLAIQKKLLEGISSGCGYTAVLIALIASNNPFGVLLTAILYAAAQVGTSSMQRQLGVPNAIVNILIGFVVILILARRVFRITVKRRETRI